MTPLQAELAALDRTSDAHGCQRSNDPRGMMVSVDELAARREAEGAHQSPRLCNGCSYSLGPEDARCPKCGATGYETANAFVTRTVDDLMAEHLGKDDANPRRVAAGKHNGHANGKASAETRRAKKGKE